MSFIVLASSALSPRTANKRETLKQSFIFFFLHLLYHYKTFLINNQRKTGVFFTFGNGIFRDFQQLICKVEILRFRYKKNKNILPFKTYQKLIKTDKN